MSKASLRTDKAIGPAIEALKNGCWPTEASLSPELTRLKREARKLAMKDGLPCHYSKRSSGETVLPKEFREMVMRAMHDDLEEHFTRYAQAFPTKSQKAAVVAKVLMEKYFVHYGLPSRIYSDQGRGFESRLFRELLTVMGIRKSWTTSYHPQRDPQLECYSRTPLSMLAMLGREEKRSWSQHVPYLVHVCNSTKRDATGYSLYHLMFG